MKRALFNIHLAVLFWGFTGVLGRLISFSAPVLVWYRMLLTVVLLAVIINFRKEWIRIARKDFYKVLGIGVMYAIHWVAFFASIKYANASVAMICLATASIFTAILYPLFNRGKFRLSELTIGFIAMAGVGVIYFLQPDSATTEGGMKDFELGVFFGVAASIISAIFTIFNKPLSEKYRARPLVFYEMLGGFVFLTLLAPFFLMQNPDELLLPTGWDYLWIFLLSYCCTVWGQSLAMKALKKLSPFTITLSVNLEPVYGIILAFIIFKENQQLGWGFYIGMSLIFVSMILQVAMLTNRKRKVKNVL